MAPVRDINVMSRRGRFGHRVTLLPAGPSWSDGTAPEITAVVALEPIAATIDGTLFHLDNLDVVMTEGGLRDLHVDGRSLLIALRGAMS